jgi:two-component sensor histidine kinase
VPALADSVEAIVRSILETGEPVTGIEIADQCPDQAAERFWMTYWHPVYDPSHEVIGINVAAEEITELRRREEHIRFVVEELSHRSKNLLTVVMAIARQTARQARDVPEYHDRFSQRLLALAECNDLLVKENWYGASFADLVAVHLKPFGDLNGDRIDAFGPMIRLKPNAVQHLGLALHELATNASKYGALAGARGRVSIEWDLDAPSQMVSVQWRERGGPIVAPPERRGFGRVVIEQIVPRALQGAGALAFAPEGVSWEFVFPAEDEDRAPTSSLANWPVSSLDERGLA